MTKKFRPDYDAHEWKGGYAPYDILKEGTIALVVVSLLVIVLAVVFGSPDIPAVTIKSWSTHDPIDFATTAVNEMNGSTITAQYGAPYNHVNSGSQVLGPLKLEQWAGVRIPINTTNDFVIDPLKALPFQPVLKADLAEWANASTAQRTTWVNNYTKADGKMAFTNDAIVEPATDAGPMPVFINDLTQMARSGALDEALLQGDSFYTMDYTKTLLFISDGNYLGNIASQQHLQGDQWGMMNETGSYPGQAWLWLYTMWYQVPPFSTSSNADIMVMALMLVLTAGLALTPFIPGLRSIPRRTRVYRVIWREHYQNQKTV